MNFQPDATTAGIETSRVTKTSARLVSVFMSLGREYMEESLIPPSERDRFLRSILARQEEPDRWLLLLRCKDEYSGFAHFKIDRNERVGWGFILEYYIIPSRRRMGLGTKFFSSIAGIFQTRGVEDVWLLTSSPSAESFWRSLGFKSTGELDKETGQKILTKKLAVRLES